MAKSKSKEAKPAKTDLRRLKKDERPAPTTGQSGPEMALPAEKLNKDERLVLAQLDTVDRAPAKIVELAEAIRKAKRNEFTTLRTRNALRRLVRGGLVTAKERGEYKITAKGTKTSIAAADLPLPAKGTKATTKTKADKGAKAKSTKTKAPKAAKITKATPAAEAKAAAPKKKSRGKKITASPESPEDQDDTPPVKPESTTDFSDEVETELAQFGGAFKRSDPHYKGAILVAAIRTAGISDTKIAKVTGLSRGFCMPRVKRLKTAGILSAPGTDEEFANAVAIAEGLNGASSSAAQHSEEHDAEVEDELDGD